MDLLGAVVNGARRNIAADLGRECAHKAVGVIAGDRVCRIGIAGQQRRERLIRRGHLIDALQTLEMEDRGAGGRELVAGDIALDRLDAESKIRLMRGEEIRSLAGRGRRARQRNAA